MASENNTNSTFVPKQYKGLTPAELHDVEVKAFAAQTAQTAREEAEKAEEYKIANNEWFEKRFIKFKTQNTTFGQMKKLITRLNSHFDNYNFTLLHRCEGGIACYENNDNLNADGLDPNLNVRFNFKNWPSRHCKFPEDIKNDYELYSGLFRCPNYIIFIGRNKK